MKNFESTFAKAVELLLKEAPGKPTPQQNVRGSGMITYSPGSGRWGAVIKGLQKEAESEDLPYERVVQKSAAKPSTAGILMLKLGVTKKSQKDDIGGVFEVLQQAVKNQYMEDAYGTPTISGKTIIVPFKISTSTEDISKGEGMKARNLGAYLHLTLIGAYNAGYLKINKKITLRKLSDGDTEISIVET